MYKSDQQDKPPPRDFRKEVTDDIIKMLEKDAAPWQRPWDAGEFGRTPFNPVTGKSYRGGNVLSLMISSMRRGYADPRFCTFKQAIDKGWHVKKGEKASYIEFWDVKPGKSDEGEDEEKRTRMVHRTYAVFNAAQIEGIPLLELPARKPFEIIQAGEDMLRNSGADIRHGGAKAFYSPSGDYVQMPPKECFMDEPHYYSTALHELAHNAALRIMPRRPRSAAHVFINAPCVRHNRGVGSETTITSTGSQLSTLLVGVFLDATEPIGAGPLVLNYNHGTPDSLSTTEPSFSPALNHVFFIGDGLTKTGAGQEQTFGVPTGADRL